MVESKKVVCKITDSEENVKGDHIEINIPLPNKEFGKDVKIKYNANSYVIEYDKVDERKGSTFYSWQACSGKTMRSYPHEILNPKAYFKNGNVVISFEKGEQVNLGEQKKEALAYKELKVEPLKLEEKENKKTSMKNDNKPGSSGESTSTK
ncbi:hypothetical protein EDEG_01096 [Edhazardia aedis USNM 41457]|uniref:Uncharacterized protein n=1 Tax=Edhazardia aedis (strain USNM 41457) TaxID=1003232 RepID=J9DQ81_EDHAE|nr:hypothetical protein EDEG_01096 [Edhazardia aedis USNM 41457]|eukprot:EJW04710.1 hypothetical protein EDEG_01096 [Edhazardia aedis USNM 41457]